MMPQEVPGNICVCHLVEMGSHSAKNRVTLDVGKPSFDLLTIQLLFLTAVVALHMNATHSDGNIIAQIDAYLY